MAALNRHLVLVTQLNLLIALLKKKRALLASKPRKRKFWIREMLKLRETHSQFHTLLEELRLHDREYFFKYTRMSPERLEHLLRLVAPYIIKKSCRSRTPISPGERLIVTLRYLATGDSQQSQAFNFRLGRSTVCNIVRETCSGLWDALQTTYLRPPSTSREWEEIANGMLEKWDFPNCIGALDGKHVAIECPANSGSLFYNYKKFYSIVLMAMCDSRYSFTLVDIGNNGRDNDAQIFNDSQMGKAFINNELDVPPARSVNGHNLPYVIVSDEIFALKSWLMKPYGGKGLPECKEIFNYQLSRCRRTIENSFGILTAKWRIFRRPIRAKPETVDLIIKACLCLHNYLIQTHNAHYIPVGFVDSEDSSGNLIPGSWRAINSGAMQCITPGRTHNRSSFDANEVRDKFMNYFLSSEGSLSWQAAYVNSF